MSAPRKTVLVTPSLLAQARDIVAHPESYVDQPDFQQTVRTAWWLLTHHRPANNPQPPTEPAPRRKAA